LFLQKIGGIIRSTGKAIIREGSVRQDVNVSIKGGDRVEIKHVPSLSLIPIVIEKEIERQKGLISGGKKVPRDVRKVLPDGSTEFLRPLAGAARMYPETDVIPIGTDTLMSWVKENLPETFEEKIAKYKAMGLSEELSKQLVYSDYVDLFDKLMGVYEIDPTLSANIFVSVLKDLERRENLNVEKISEEDFEELFELISNGKIMKESISDILKFKIKNPNASISDSIKKLKLESIPDEELDKIIKNIIKENKGLPENKIIGFVMREVRGKVDPKKAVEKTKKMLQ
jgi:glutamyl-tRNA(Gln) amidotransferase subunit E